MVTGFGSWPKEYGEFKQPKWVSFAGWPKSFFGVKWEVRSADRTFEWSSASRRTSWGGLGILLGCIIPLKVLQACSPSRKKARMYRKSCKYSPRASRLECPPSTSWGRAGGGGRERVVWICPGGLWILLCVFFDKHTNKKCDCCTR